MDGFNFLVEDIDKDQAVLDNLYNHELVKTLVDLGADPNARLPGAFDSLLNVCIRKEFLDTLDVLMKCNDCSLEIIILR